MKPLFLKTYGKQKRRVSAWIATDSHKKAFDTSSSTSSSDSDTSVFEPPGHARLREKKTDVDRVRRPVRRKAVQCLAERSFTEENAQSPPRPQSKRTREKTKGAAGRGVRPVKRKVMPVVYDSSDEENIVRESAGCPQPTQQSMRTRRSRLVLQPAVSKRQRAQKAPRSSESEEDSMSAAKYLKTSLETKPSHNVSLSTAGRFVTRRRPAVAAKFQKATVVIGDSSGDFTSDMSKIHGRKKRGRRRLPSLLLSSAESSVQAVLGADSCQELSLDELTDLRVGRRLRKPICCSTPSAPPLGQRPQDEAASASCQGVLSAFSEWQAFSPPQSSPPPEHQSEAEQGNSLTKACSVPLQKLNFPSPADLHNSTAYLSCLSRLRSQQDEEQPQSVHSVSQRLEPSLNLCLSRTQSVGNSPSANGYESPSEHAAASQSNNHSESADPVFLEEHPPLKEPLEQSASVLLTESTHHTDSSVDFIMDTHLAANSPKPARPPEEVKNRCLAKKCSVKVEKLNVQQPTCLMEGKRSSESELETVLKKSCLSDKLTVNIKRVPVEDLRRFLQPRAAEPESPTESACDLQQQQPETDSSLCDEQPGSSSSGDGDGTSSSDRDGKRKPGDVTRKREKKEKRQKRSVSTDRPGTTRKACVSGLSVSRWKSKDTSHVFGSKAARLAGNSSLDCSINELVSNQHKPTYKELMGSTMNLSTPTQLNRSSIMSLLNVLTPNTHTWSRIKAALSVHRKVLLTPGGDCKTPHRLPLSASARRGKAELATVSQDLFATPRRVQGHRLTRSSLLSSDSLAEAESVELSDAEKVYAECGQQGPLAWEECVPPQRMKRCVKIGEGTFGEVFSTTNASGQPVALKIIPVEGSEKVNGEDQKTFGEILHEIIISKELSSLKEKQHNKTFGFIGLNDLHCIRGCYPPEFLNAWDTFDRQRGSENDRPDFFEEDQVFIMLEFEFGGTDLENSDGTFKSLAVAKSVLHQVTAALAVAEQELHFEHRDLHWGNVLVKTTRQKKENFLLNGASHSVDTRGVLVRVIDYSLSRLEIDGLTVSCDISQDEELFMGQGDYQFEIYRLMRQENGNDWSTYHPHSNVLWLHYLCSKLLSMKYRGAGGKAAKDVREELTRFHDNVLQYGSATEALRSCPMFR